MRHLGLCFWSQFVSSLHRNLRSSGLLNMVSSSTSRTARTRTLVLNRNRPIRAVFVWPHCLTSRRLRGWQGPSLTDLWLWARAWRHWGRWPTSKKVMLSSICSDCAASCHLLSSSGQQLLAGWRWSGRVQWGSMVSCSPTSFNASCQQQEQWRSIWCRCHTKSLLRRRSKSSASSPTHRRKSNSSASISRVCPVALVGWSLMEYQAGSWDGSSRTETCNSVSRSLRSTRGSQS
mmetsp:Transcript_28143/g.76117  ORF Transcript_28143/g.76117 Transcript_28143/m.76117 type:complete len:233 (-) Transcript_28143:170-868(-)